MFVRKFGLQKGILQPVQSWDYICISVSKSSNLNLLAIKSLEKMPMLRNEQLAII